MSQGARFLYNFSIGSPNVSNPGVNVISVTSTATGDFDKAHLCTNPLRETWRSSDVSLQEIILEANDLANPIDTFALLNHNLTSLAVVTLQANNFNNFSSPAFSTTMVWNKKHMVYLNELADNYQFFKIKILDPTNPCGFIEIGKIVGGSALIMQSNEDITDDFTITPDDLAYQMKTEGFFRASNEKVKVDKLSVKFDKLTTVGNADNYNGLLSMTEYVGTTIPFLTILDSNDSNFFIIWGQLNDMPSRAFTINRYTSLGLTIQEVY